MQLARVIGEVVSTMKDANLVGAKLLVLQPIDAAGNDFGRTLVALDSVGAGDWRTRVLRPRPRSCVSFLSRRAAYRRVDRRNR